jgi:predicted nucleic acid-binding protein
LSKFVVDANVAVKWVLPQQYSENASLLLNNKCGLLVPDFFFSEIGNILWKEVRFGSLTLEEAKLNFNQIAIAPIEVYSSQELMPSALEIAVRLQQAVYDCLYLALAIDQKCKMITADKRFINSLKGDILAPYLCWVADFTEDESGAS